MNNERDEIIVPVNGEVTITSPTSWDKDLDKVQDSDVVRSINDCGMPERVEPIAFSDITAYGEDKVALGDGIIKMPVVVVTADLHKDLVGEDLDTPYSAVYGSAVVNNSHTVKQSYVDCIVLQSDDDWNRVRNVLKRFFRRL